MPSETTNACVSLLVFFRIRPGTFLYGVEDDASTISQTPTTHYTNTCVKLTIVTHLSFSERIAIANLSFILSTLAKEQRICGPSANKWIFKEVMSGLRCCCCILHINRSGLDHSFWTSSSLDVPAGVTQAEGHTGFLIHLLSAVRAFIFLARRIQPFLSLVDRVLCVFSSYSFWTSMDVPAGVTQDFPSTFFLWCLP